MGEATTALCGLLMAGGLVVGDGVAPEEGGWVEGAPNSPGGFVPYVVVKPSGAVTAHQGGYALCMTTAVMISAPYTVTAYEHSRIEADRLAALSRAVMKSGRWAVPFSSDLVLKQNSLYIDSVVGASRDDSVYPKMWSAATNLRLVLARSS